jgi:PAS domain S-box-containing protein
MTTSWISNLKIGQRLTLCFAIIILLMLVGNSLLAWQFHLVNEQSDRVTALAQELAVVSRFQIDLLSLDTTLDSLAKSEDLEGVRREATHSRSVLANDLEAIRAAHIRLPSELREDAVTLPAAEGVEKTWLPQLDSVISLGAASDWNAVRLRLADEKRPLEASVSELVRSVQQQVTDELERSVVQSEHVKSRILLILSLIAFLTLLIAILLAAAITSSITIPLRQLLEGSAALARGEFDHRVHLGGKDELAQVGAVFNETTAKLGEVYRKLEEAQRIAHVGHWERDLATNRITWSDETYRIFGLQPQGQAMDLASLRQRIHPEDWPLVSQAIKDALSGSARYNVEYRLLRPTNEVRIVHSKGDVKRDSSGRPYEMFGTVQDITERKHSEEQREKLRQLEDDLAHINRVSMLGEMAASLAHEIKQPITAAITSANTCREWLAHDPPNLDRARAAATRIDKYGNRAAEMIDRIRSFYKKSPSQRELVDANGIVREILMLLRGEATRCSVATRTELAPAVPEIMADRVQLQQVFMNLMLNAIEAMQDTGGELMVKSQLEDGKLLFSISDTGVGLPPGNIDQIFSAFFTTKPEGSGMGLAISRSIVEAHGGRLWALPNDGRGATFHFILPIQMAGASSLAT